MNSDEVISFLQRLPVCHVGVYAADCLPVKIPKLSAIVVNTDPQNLSGTHWISFFLDSHGNLEYFDSFGQPPRVFHHIKFINRNSKHYVYNRNILQSYNSTACAHYCLCYLYFRSVGLSLDYFTSLFTSSPDGNDDLVLRLFNSLYITW